MSSASFSTSLAILLLVNQATAGSFHRPGVFEDDQSPNAAAISLQVNHAIRDTILTPTGCTSLASDAASVLSILRDPANSFHADSFCSSYNQPVITATSTAWTTNLITSFATTTVSSVTTTTSTIPGTATSLCPIPTKHTTCAKQGYGNLAYNIAYGQGISATTCHQLCLANPDCMSFQIQLADDPWCNLYNVGSSTPGLISEQDTDKSFWFYDRDCLYFLPDGCIASSLSTPVPTVPVFLGGSSVRKRAPFPTFITSSGVEVVSQACSCIVASPSPARYTNTTLNATTTVFTLVTQTLTTLRTTTEEVKAVTTFISVS